jgi:hypothetical protein
MNLASMAANPMLGLVTAVTLAVAGLVFIASTGLMFYLASIVSIAYTKMARGAW